MAKKIFVAGLAYSVSDEQLGELFSQFGQVESAKVIIDHDTGRSKGFGFVEMSSDQECMNAISSLHETQYEGRSLQVKEARPKGGTPNNNSSFGSRNNSYNNNKGRGGSNRRY